VRLRRRASERTGGAGADKKPGAILGGVFNIDIPELGSTLKVKALTTAIAANAVKSTGVAVGWVRKFY
jgi:hypothetical protein